MSEHRTVSVFACLIAYLLINFVVCVLIDYYGVTRNIVRYGDEKNMSGPAYYVYMARRMNKSFPWKRILLVTTIGIPALGIAKAAELLERVW